MPDSDGDPAGGQQRSAGEVWLRTLLPDPAAQAALDEVLRAVRRHEAVFASRRATSFDFAATAATTPLALAAAAVAGLALPAN
eukprot:gene3198-2927_t